MRSSFGTNKNTSIRMELGKDSAYFFNQTTIQQCISIIDVINFCEKKGQVLTNPYQENIEIHFATNKQIQY